MNRLLLMSGIHHPEGWVTLDANPANGASVCATIPPIPEVLVPGRMILGNCSPWDHVEWIHGINMVYPWEAEQILRELLPCMAPDGLLVLEQPDLRQLIAAQRVEWIYGDPRPQEPLHMVKWAYAPNMLIDLVLRCGWQHVEPRPAQHHVPARDFRIEARP